MENVTMKDKIMQEEIFGPLLPILPITGDIDEAIDFVTSEWAEKPLASYIFTENSKSAEKWLTQVSSGGACVNEVMMQYTCNSLPFGGVGHSGCGAYHGKYSFDAFT